MKTKFTTALKRISPHILTSEVSCKCCGRGADKIHPEIIRIFETIREIINRPINITRGYSCLKHQKELISKGYLTSLHSPHRYYTALDCVPPAGISLEEFRDIARDVSKDVRIGWKAYSQHIHIDVAYIKIVKKKPTKAARLSWVEGVEW
ncbi:hypothetical protein KKC52_12685 [bacterium]|nr:hypothetical protein [bacterium]